jgi:hypothetical protein
MPRVQLPDGRVVAFPDGMSQAEMEEALGKVPPLTPPPAPTAPPQRTGLFSSPQGFRGPGFLANLESRMTGKTPQEAYATRVPQLETAANLLGTVLAPGRSVLGQMGGQAAVQGGLEMLEGKGPLRAAQSAGTAAAGAGALGGLGKFLGLQGAGARAATELEAAQKAYPGRSRSGRMRRGLRVR